MAVRTPTITYGGPSRPHEVLVVWTGLLNGDQGAPVELEDFTERTVNITGTFGAGGSINIEGNLDGTNNAILTDPQGNAITKASAAIERIQEVTRQVRPNVTAGDGTTNLTVTLYGRRTRN